MVGEEILFQEFGPVIALIIIMSIMGKWIVQKAFEQVEIANKALQENNKTNQTFVQESLNKNTVALTNMSSCLESHIKLKDEAIESMKDSVNTIKEQSKIINDLFDMVKNRKTIGNGKL